MIKNVALLLLGALVGALGLFAYQLQPAAVPKTPQDANLTEAFDAFVSSISELGDFVESHAWYASEQEQAEAYRHIARIVMGSVPEAILIDPDFPYFYEIGPFNKSGMDNSDQRYLSTMLNSAGEYRVWGTRGNSRSLDFTLYEADALSSSLATLSTEQLQTNPDGSFEVFIGGRPREQNWLPMEPGVRRLLVRQIHSDWNNELPGEVHIDRIDSQRPAYPTLNKEIMSQRLLNAAQLIATNGRRWPEYSRTKIAGLLPANTLAAPRSVGDTGGLAGRLMVGGHFELQSDEALVIKAWPTDASYQGIQLGHHWWESLDYANRQSSLTLDQASVSEDGAIYYVVAAKDPGVANWLDTEGFPRGVILMRFDGMGQSSLEKSKHPQATLVKLSELSALLPAGEIAVTSDMRRAEIAKRRKHVQQRFGL